jgi:adenylate cyclase class 2
MDRENIEIEAKFYIRDLDSLREILLSLGGHLIHERILERNWRFDTPSRRLSAAGEVLRIREDNRIRLTYKRPIQGTLERMEIEIEVDDSKKTRMFLEALGFEVFFVYEKFRETYKFDDMEIVLDEVPYGCFVEIEGPSVALVQKTATQLKLNWEHRLKSTYLRLFKRLKEKLNLPFTDATFDAFSQVGEIPLDDLNLVDGLQSDLPMEQRE